MIRSELGEGATSWVPYGGSVDVSEWERDLLQRADELVESYKAEKRKPPPRRGAAANRSAAGAHAQRKKK